MVVYGQGLSPEKERRKIAAIMAPAQNFKHTISPCRATNENASSHLKKAVT
jgi:hypothetical protein